MKKRITQGKASRLATIIALMLVAPMAQAYNGDKIPTTPTPPKTPVLGQPLAPTPPPFNWELPPSTEQQDVPTIVAPRAPSWLQPIPPVPDLSDTYVPPSPFLAETYVPGAIMAGDPHGDPAVHMMASESEEEIDALTLDPKIAEQEITQSLEYQKEHGIKATRDFYEQKYDRTTDMQYLPLFSAVLQRLNDLEQTLEKELRDLVAQANGDTNPVLRHFERQPVSPGNMMDIMRILEEIKQEQEMQSSEEDLILAEQLQKEIDSEHLARRLQQEEKDAHEAMRLQAEEHGAVGAEWSQRNEMQQQQKRLEDMSNTFFLRMQAHDGDPGKAIEEIEKSLPSNHQDLPILREIARGFGWNG